MALTHGPLMFFTDGTDASLAALANVATFAATMPWQLQVLHVLDDEAQAARAARIEATVAALPSRGAAPQVRAVRSEEVGHSLQGAGEATGVLALQRAQRRFLTRFLPDKSAAQLLHGWQLPVLTLPATIRSRPVARVLFPADLAPRSLTAFDEAVSLCESLDATLHVLHVFGDDRRLPTDKDMERRLAARSPHDLLAIDRDAMQELVYRATARGVPTQMSTAEGRAHMHILGYAAAADIDMIIMPTHGPRTMEDIVRGTTTARVVRGASVPVMSLRSRGVRAGVSASA